MDFNAPDFEGFVIPQNNQQPPKAHFSSMSASSGKVRTKYFDIFKEISTETTSMTKGVEVVSNLGQTPNMLGSENCQTFYDLSSSLSAWSDADHKKMMIKENMVETVNETTSFLKRTPIEEPKNQRTLYDLLPPPSSRARLNDGHEPEGQQLGFNHFHMVNPLLRANQQQQQMFNSSSSSLEVEVLNPFLNKNGGLEHEIINSQDFTVCQPPPTSTRSYIGDGSEKLKINAGEGRVIITPLQLMELQDQSLIYNYISANMVVPPHLLTNCLCSHCTLPASNSTSSPTTWGRLRQGTYPGSSLDPEPGRCRRSDGKKWRCSNDAVVDEKYCEKHRSRGRIRKRSRKSAPRGRKGAATNTGMVVAGASSGPAAVKIESGSSFVNVLQQNQLKNSEPAAFDNSAALCNW